MADAHLSKPLTKAEFTDALTHGKGRALMHLRQFGDEGLQDVLLEASLHEWGFDPQCEGRRDDWMMEIIQSTSMPERYFESILGEFLETTNMRDAAQQSGIVAMLAEKGKEGARALLYRKFDLRQFDDTDHIGRDIVGIDGLPGLLYVVSAAGKRLQTDNTRTENNWLIDFACKLIDRDEVLSALEKTAVNDPDVKAYLDNVLTTSGSLIWDDKPSALEPEQPVPLESLIEQIDALTSESKRMALRGDCFRFARHATEEELQALLDRMLQETRREQLLRYLWCFSRNGIPRANRQIFMLADSEDAYIRDMAITALVPRRDETVREFAVGLLNAGRFHGIELFRNNLRDGDFAFILSCLKAINDNDIMHALCMDLTKVCEANINHGALDCLVFAYENTPCSLCREHVVRGLIELGNVPDWIMTEAQYDSYDETRKAIAEYAKNHIGSLEG